MKYVISLLSLFFLGCGSGSGSGSATILGVDFTGTYNFRNITCINYAGAITNVSSPTGTFTDVLTISGNSETEAISDGTCRADASATVQLTAANAILFTNMKNVSSTNGNCTVHVTGSNNAVTPNAFSTTYVSPTASPDVNGSYVYNSTSKFLYIKSTFTDAGNDDCYLAYQKQ